MNKNLLKVLKLLFVDDDDIISYEAEAATGDLFENFRIAKNGNEAMDIYRINSFDVVITDITMPIKNGVELCREIKKINQKQRIIVTSSTEDTKHIIELINLGVNRFIPKPMNYDLLLEYLAEIAQNIENEKNLKIYQEELEAKNMELQEALDKLKTTQDKLVESEKMASLGMLVSGVAHEINTPLGIAITSYSMLKDKIESTSEKLKNGTLKKSDLEKCFDVFPDTDKLITGNLEKSAKLVQTFKQISVNEHTETAQKINIYELVTNLLSIYKPALEQNHITPLINSCTDMLIVSYKNILETLFSKLIENSIDHAFLSEQSNKQIEIAICADGDRLNILYKDNGKGIPHDQIKNIFVPFYTTARSSGKKGLGLSIVYNLVTQTLKGSIELDETVTNGAGFFISIPIGAT